MRKFRVVIEDERTGQEIAGHAGLSRKFVDAINAFIKARGDHDLSVGGMPKRRGPKGAPPVKPATRARR